MCSDQPYLFLNGTHKVDRVRVLVRSSFSLRRTSRSSRNRRGRPWLFRCNGRDQWRESYNAQGEQKRAQIDQMIRYEESNQCRMASLVRHFGDLADGQKPCGICDFCAPGQCAAQRFRTATEAERAALLRVVATLRSGGPKATGKLYRELCPNREMNRGGFEEVLGAMARVGLVQLSDEVFQKDGKQILYRKASLTRAGYAVHEKTTIELIMKETALPSAKRNRKKKKPTVSEGRKAASTPETAARPSLVGKGNGSEAGTESRLEAALRIWRLVEARRRGVPAFRIFSYRTLRALASSRPATTQELLAVPGIGLNTVEKYGTEIYRVLRQNGG
jgi:superfamily II DNA helicase RecQ